MSEPTLPVLIVVAGEEITGFINYDITTAITDPVDTFAFRVPFSRKAWDLLKPDQPMRVTVGGVPIITGFVDDSPMPDDAEVIDVSGRCRMSRVVDESAPGVNFSGLGIAELAAKLATPWFTKVSLSNARNRNIVRGRGKKARAASEPVKINTKSGTVLEPGQMRWNGIERILQQTGYIAWSSADGTELIIGKPNYEQEIQFRFFRPMPGSQRAREGNVLGMAVNRTTAERYSRVICIGSGAGTDVNYGATVASRYGVARNNPAKPEGEGLDFSAPKTLVVQNSVKSIAEATELAQREMAQRDAKSKGITIRARGHGQQIAGPYVTVFAPDTMAFVEDEYTNLKGAYLITSCNFRTSRDGGDETLMHLVPKNTELGR